MYANSTVANSNVANSTVATFPVANSIVAWEEITITEGSTLILTCPTNFSTRTLWEKSPVTHPRFTTYADNSKIDPSIEHANRLRVVGNFSIGIYNLQILNVSQLDEGIYRCSYINNNMYISHYKEIRVSIKSKYYLKAFRLSELNIFLILKVANIRYFILIAGEIFHVIRK